jgi:NodT family efflux transporter outer membrane factor (OMF) lipoprotein
VAAELGPEFRKVVQKSLDSVYCPGIWPPERQSFLADEVDRQSLAAYRWLPIAMSIGSSQTALTGNMSSIKADVPLAFQRRACMLALVVVLLPALSLCACALPPARVDQKLPFDVPAAWSISPAEARGGAASLVDWWWRFDDPLLGTLVTQALAKNTSVNSAQAALLQARALRDVAAAGLWPSLGGSASTQHGTSGGHSTGNNFQADLNVNWVPDVFGLNRSALNVAISTAEASAATLGDVQVSIAAEAGLNYVALRSAQARLEIANANLASQLETQQITEWRQQAGLVTVLEVEQARAAAKQTDALLPTLQTAIEQTRHALAVLTGQPPAALATLLAATSPVPQAEANLALSIPAETLRQRADVRAAERKVAAALARVDQADAARLPSFVLSGSLGLNALTLGTLTNGASVVSSLVASMAAPIFDGGAARAQLRAEQSAFDQAHLAYEATVLTALKDVEDALIALQGDRQRLASLRNAGEAAATASLLARQRYSSGLVDFQVVLETQRTQLSTQDSLANANADVSSDHIRLYKALGGGWRPESSSASKARIDQVSIP